MWIGLEGDKYPFTDMVNVLSKPANTSEELSKIQSILKSSDKDILILCMILSKLSYISIAAYSK